MYFRLGCDLGPTAGYIIQKDNQHEPLMDGAIVDENELTLPWPFTVKPDPEDGLKMDNYYAGKMLMSKRLVGTLQSAGVDNLQIFPAVIKNTETGEIINDYFVVNIIGLVSCADMDASDSSPLAAGYFFNNLVIDPTRTHGLLMFRLVESVMEVIVHEKVAKAIQKGEFTGVTLEPLSETAP